MAGIPFSPSGNLTTPADYRAAIVRVERFCRIRLQVRVFHHATNGIYLINKDYGRGVFLSIF
ncbi:MAG: hypothetical protein KKA07_14340, partial [Bacteroidetes bacterium]|nr:hypothetical protein [Bacteroidota bacterium]